MKYACFISYRHPGNPDTAKLVRAFGQALESRICLHVAGARAYLDEDKLTAGDIYQEELAAELCASACMVLLFNRSYFDLTHHFCAREYQAMLRLEQQRLALAPDDFRSKGLILPVTLRDPDRLPFEIRGHRHYHDISKLTLVSRSFQSTAWTKELDAIARVVADRYYAVRSLPAHEHDCAGFRLPPFAEIESWLRQVVAESGPVTLPGRQ
jgi:hypothetical protein